MSLVGLIFFIVVIALILYLVQLLPLDARLMNIIRIVVILVAVVYLLEAIGLFSGPIFRYR